ncbi:hypothetical protein BDV11DRAFT_43240 [Aspergillus similis]
MSVLTLSVSNGRRRRGSVIRAPLMCLVSDWLQQSIRSAGTSPRYCRFVSFRFVSFYYLTSLGGSRGPRDLRPPRGHLDVLPKQNYLKTS